MQVQQNLLALALLIPSVVTANPIAGPIPVPADEILFLTREADICCGTATVCPSSCTKESVQDQVPVKFPLMNDTDMNELQCVPC